LLKQKLDSLIDEMISRGIRFREARREFEKRFIAQVLERENGNLSRAAKILRIHRNTLAKKIHDYKIKVR
jgi:DNA-binding NtrC family response regulator